MNQALIDWLWTHPDPAEVKIEVDGTVNAVAQIAAVFDLHAPLVSS